MSNLKTSLVACALVCASSLWAEGSCTMAPKICMNFLQGYSQDRARSACKGNSGSFSAQSCAEQDRVGTCLNRQGNEQILTVFYSASGSTTTVRVMCMSTGGQFAP